MKKSPTKEASAEQRHTPPEPTVSVSPKQYTELQNRSREGRGEAQVRVTPTHTHAHPQCTVSAKLNVICQHAPQREDENWSGNRE